MHNQPRVRTPVRLLALLAGWAAALPQSLVLAQTAPAAADVAAGGATDSGISEVTVTARRRSENLEDVPIAVTAVSAATIENYNIQNIEDLGSYVPNMKISQDRATSSTINVYIRGVGQSDPLWGFQPGVGV